jgi:hypothetical protein
MGCRCNERGEAIASAFTAAFHGDAQKVGDEIRRIGETIRDDTIDFTRRINAARSSLMRR